MTIAPPSTPARDAGVDPFIVAMIRAISENDAPALARFYEGWFDRAFELARRLTGRDESFCLDVVQEAMMKVLRSLRPSLGITTAGALDAWFSRVVHTTAIDLLRREARRRRRETSHRRAGVRPSGEDAAALVALEDQAAWIAAELAREGDLDASLAALRFGHHQSLEAMGEHHSMTPAAVHGRLRRLFDRLRHKREEDHHA